MMFEKIAQIFQGFTADLGYSDVFLAEYLILTFWCFLKWGDPIVKRCQS
jgi:hypothetical protein